MIAIIISLMFFSLAAYFNAVMDTLQFHFDRSVFSHKDPNFWNPAKSWQAAKFFPGTKYRMDAWHLFKSAMIVSSALSAVVLLYGLDFVMPWWGYPGILIVYGVVWIATFNAFFDVLLLKKM